MRGNLINALRKNPDVIDADVVINVPDKEEFGSSDAAQKKRPSASLVIKIRPTAEAQATLTEAKLQRVVASASPDLEPRDVTVIVSYVGGAPAGSLPGQALPVITAGGPVALPPGMTSPKSTSTVTVAGVEVAPDSSNRLKIYLGVFLALLALLSIALIITVIHTHRIRQEARTPSTTVDGQLMGPDDNKRLGSG
jgi:type III secretory pathway lipoprotein EscJ